MRFSRTTIYNTYYSIYHNFAHVQCKYIDSLSDKTIKEKKKTKSLLNNLRLFMSHWPQVIL